MKGDKLENLMQKEVIDPLGMTRNYIIAYPKEKMGVVYLANSFCGLGVVQEIISHSLGGVEPIPIIGA